MIVLLQFSSFIQIQKFLSAIHRGIRIRAWLPSMLLLKGVGTKSFKHSSRRRGTCDGTLAVHPRNLWVRGSILTRGSQPAKRPSFGGYSLETLNLIEGGRPYHQLRHQLASHLSGAAALKYFSTGPAPHVLRSAAGRILPTASR